MPAGAQALKNKHLQDLANAGRILMQVYKVHFPFAKNSTAMQLRLISFAMLTACLFCSYSAQAQTSTTATKDKVAKSSIGSSDELKAVAQVEGISEYRLSNGLRVLLAPDASKPTTTVNITYLVGSRHDAHVAVNRAQRAQSFHHLVLHHHLGIGQKS